MIREVIREAWAQSPARVLVAVVAVPVVVYLVRLLLVWAIVAGQP